MTNDSPTSQLKEAGNQAFAEGDWDKALSFYTQALNLIELDTPEKAILYKNKAAVYLKVSDYEAAIKDCTTSLEICPNDPKALFRRCQAYEALEKFEEAYKDARQVHNLDKNNKAIAPVLKRLHDIVQDRMARFAQTTTKVTQMMEIAFDLSTTVEKRETATSNLLVLAKESAGADLLVKEGIFEKINSLLKKETTPSIVVSCIRIVSALCKGNLPRAKMILQLLGVPWLLDQLNSNNDDQVSAAQYCCQTVINTISGLDLKDDKQPDKALCEANRKEIDTILTCLIYCSTSRTITGKCRDAVLELMMRNCEYRALDWAERLVDINGLQRMMQIASELEEMKYESSMEITENTRTIISCALGKVYDNMYYDLIKERFSAKIEDFIHEQLQTPGMESKVRVVVAVTTLLLGPLDVGSSIIGKEGVLEMILVMANSGDFLMQRVSCEALIAAASKKDKASAILAQGVTILKKLYQIGNDNIKVRALVGLCKLGSCGGTDSSWKPFTDGSTMKLAEACRRFLINPAKDKDMRKWAIEGLSYLTLDAEVKEKLIEDKEALQSLIEVAKSGDFSVIYGVVSTLVNLCNAYDKQEIIPEMLELAKFAKRHVPEQHELDDPDFVHKRVDILGKAGVTVGLVSLCKTESENCKELIARVFNAICEHQNLRGIVVQQGGAKALIPLALEGTAKGKYQASQALARIGITINPEVAFPGQRMCELIRPLLGLLDLECNALENFEALMALCNLAGFEAPRKRIIKENGVSKIENYMYENHEMLQKAAVQAMSNLLFSEEVVKLFEGKNDRTKYMILLSTSEDIEMSKAAAGALAILTSVSKRASRKVFEALEWKEILCFLLSNTDKDVQYRGAVIVKNIASHSKELAEKLLVPEVLMVLDVLSKFETPEMAKVTECVKATLQLAEQWKLVEKEDESEDELYTNIVDVIVFSHCHRRNPCHWQPLHRRHSGCAQFL